MFKGTKHLALSEIDIKRRFVKIRSKGEPVSISGQMMETIGASVPPPTAAAFGPSPQNRLNQRAQVRLF